MRAANERRRPEFAEGLRTEGFEGRFLAPPRLDEVARGSARPPHLVAVDAEGACASVTCSNGTGSGLLVPGTGVHVNNMLGEEDLNPPGFHRIPPGRGVPSMMAPTVVLRDGEVVARPRQRRLQPDPLGDPADDRRAPRAAASTPAAAIAAPRVHFEAGTVQAEPGVDEEALTRIERRGTEVVRWSGPNLFFGGVQAVARDPATGSLSGGGDPRRGGAAVVA